jgi:hypothetical protein
MCARCLEHFPAMDLWFCMASIVLLVAKDGKLLERFHVNVQ